MLNYCDLLFVIAKVKYMCTQNIVALRYLLGLDALLSKPLSSQTLGRGVALIKNESYKSGNGGA